jgi:hypothetical protein
MNDITPSCMLSLNPVIKRFIKRWNWHIESILNAGTVLVLNLTLRTLISCEVLVLTWIMARRTGDSPTPWSMHLFK